MAMTHACETNCLHDSSFHHTPCKLLLKCSTDRQQTAMLSIKIAHLVCPRHMLCRMYHMQLHYTLAQLRAAGSGGSHTIAERQTLSFSFLCIGSDFPTCRLLSPLMGPMTQNMLWLIGRCKQTYALSSAKTLPLATACASPVSKGYATTKAHSMCRLTRSCGTLSTKTRESSQASNQAVNLPQSSQKSNILYSVPATHL